MSSNWGQSQEAARPGDQDRLIIPVTATVMAMVTATVTVTVTATGMATGMAMEMEKEGNLSG